MHLSMPSFSKNSEGLFCGLGLGLDAERQPWVGHWFEKLLDLRI